MTAWAAGTKKERFLKQVALLPSQEAIYVGRVFDIDKKEDGLTVVQARVTTKAIAPEYLNMMIRLDGPLAAIKIAHGQMITFKGLALAFSPALSKSHFDGLRFALVNNLHASVTLKEPSLLHLADNQAPTLFAYARTSLKERIFAALTPREASLLLALIIGDTHLFSHHQQTIYQKIGAQHLLAVSGLQVTLLAWLCFLLLRPLVACCLPARLFHYAQAITAIITIFLILGFIGLAGFPSSAVRAFLMATAMFLSCFIARKIDTFDALYFSGLITILFMPESILDLGFLLSYAAVFGLLLAHHRSHQLQKALATKSVLASFFVSIAISSVAAFLATLPILAINFGSFAPYGVLANLVLVPIAVILQIPAIVMGLLGGLFDAPLVIKTASLFSNTIEIFAELLSDRLGSISFLPTLSSISLILATSSIAVLFLYVLKPQRLLLLAGIMLAVYPIITWLVKRPRLTVTVIPVGQGDATIFSLPDGTKLLLDAGGYMYGDFDPGARIVLPTLQRQGIKQLDILAISHPDPDHINGAFAILDNMPVKEIWHSGFAIDHPLTKRLLAKASLLNIIVKNAHAILGSHRFGETEVQVLAPYTGTNEPYFSELSSNDNSLVLRIVHNGYALLWPGDIEYFGEHLLMDAKLDLSAHVLKAPHHGSKTSSSEDFINRVKPGHVIYSTGIRNRFNFPHQEVIKRYDKRGILSWNTATDGEITINIANDKISIEGYRQAFKEKT